MLPNMEKNRGIFCNIIQFLVNYSICMKIILHFLSKYAIMFVNSCFFNMVNLLEHERENGVFLKVEL